MAGISTATKDLVAGIAAEATRIETPCGDGHMVWHRWGGGPALVLLHGGYGSWMHWIRNVLPLARDYSVIAPDLPGLGCSATPPEPHTAESLAQIIAAGLAMILPGGERFHLAGFSFGGVVGGHVAALLGAQVRGFTIVGSNGLGLPRQPTELERQKPGGTVDELLAIARHNLGVLMIADKDKIDDLAVYIQYLNAPRGRVRSRRFSRTDTLLQALPRVTARLSGIWGGRDAGAGPYLDERRRVLDSIQPGLRFEVIPGAGHWVAYEAADAFTPLLAEIVGQHQG
ncbi:MAG TPA: alpha/beta fold hydrolase [Stellaceae bacterium]|nr:alpha/beta fold hydrolase [Stellaceae bacterium]